jgi:hypothetical protein
MPANPRFDINMISSIIRNDTTNHSGDMSINKKDSKSILLDQPFDIGLLRPSHKEELSRPVDSITITMSQCRHLLASNSLFCEHVRTILAKILPNRSISDVPAEVVLMAALSVEAIVNPNGGMIRKTIINNHEIVNELIAKFGEMVRVTIGVGEVKKQEEVIEPGSTEAALQRVEELKRKYTPEQIVEMRKLRAEVESMLSEFEKAEENDREKVLAKYGITKFQGRRVHGDPVAFIRDPKNGYARFLDVLFKAEVRRVNKTLADALREVLRGSSENDPLMTEDERTETIAAGILGNELEQKIAMATIQSRAVNKIRLSLYKEEK